VWRLRPDNTRCCCAEQAMPFAQPALADLLAAIDFAIDKNGPARGEYTGAV
jgi:hypothetical protein